MSCVATNSLTPTDTMGLQRLDLDVPHSPSAIYGMRHEIAKYFLNLTKQFNDVQPTRTRYFYLLDTVIDMEKQG